MYILSHSHLQTHRNMRTATHTEPDHRLTSTLYTTVYFCCMYMMLFTHTCMHRFRNRCTHQQLLNQLVTHSFKVNMLPSCTHALIHLPLDTQATKSTLLCVYEQQAQFTLYADMLRTSTSYTFTQMNML